MAITPLQRKKLQRYLVLALLLVVFVTAFVLWRGFFAAGTPEAPVGGAPLQRTVELNKGILEHPIFQRLQEPRQAPSVPSDIGRDNPFLAP